MIEEKSPSLTPISSISKAELKKLLIEGFKSVQLNEPIALNENQFLAHHLNYFSEGIQFNLGYVPLKHLGYKFVIASMSPLLEKYVDNQYIDLSVSMSNRFTLEAMNDLFSGIQLACDRYEITLTNLEINSSVQGLHLISSAFGFTSEQKNTAIEENDLLVVSGDLGAALMGLHILERENAAWKGNPQHQPDLSEYSYLLQRQLKPEARTDILETIDKLEVTPKKIKLVNNGLSDAVLKLSEQEKFGFDVYESKIPMDPMVIKTSEEFGLNPVTTALNGGEDYELLLVISPNDFEKIKGNPNLSIIGYATEKEGACYLINQTADRKIPLRAPDFETQESKEQ